MNYMVNLYNCLGLYLYNCRQGPTLFEHSLAPSVYELDL